VFQVKEITCTNAAHTEKIDRKHNNLLFFEISNRKKEEKKKKKRFQKEGLQPAALLASQGRTSMADPRIGARGRSTLRGMAEGAVGPLPGLSVGTGASQEAPELLKRLQGSSP
jgi:hypothetical protein